MGSDLVVGIGEELGALLSFRAYADVGMKVECALNGILEECHYGARWLREMGIEDSKVGRNMLEEFKSIGVVSTLESVPVLDRVLMSRQDRSLSVERAKSD